MFCKLAFESVASQKETSPTNLNLVIVLRINGKPISAANLNELFQELDDFARNNNKARSKFFN